MSDKGDFCDVISTFIFLGLRRLSFGKTHPLPNNYYINKLLFSLLAFCQVMIEMLYYGNEPTIGVVLIPVQS